MNSSIKIVFWILVVSASLIIKTKLFAQNFRKICTSEIANIEKATADQSGNIFLTTINGDIRKINTICEEELIFSPEKTGRIKQIDIWSPFKVFAFYEELQEYIVLNRFLASPIRYNFTSLDIGYVSNATLNFQQNLWLIDESDFTLKLVDTERNEVLISQQLSQFLDLTNHEITFLMEQKGRLFIVDAIAGILIFDNFGTYLNKIFAKNIKSIQYEGDHLIYHSDNVLNRLFLKTFEVDSLLTPPIPYSNLLKVKDTFYGIRNDRLDIYQYLRAD